MPATSNSARTGLRKPASIWTRRVRGKHELAGERLVDARRTDDRRAEDLDGLPAHQEAREADRVAADVPQAAAAPLRPQPDVVRAAQREAEAAAREADRRRPRRESTSCLARSVCGWCRYMKASATTTPALARGRLDAVELALAERERLLAQHVLASRRGARRPTRRAGGSAAGRRRRRSPGRRAGPGRSRRRARSPTRARRPRPWPCRGSRRRRRRLPGETRSGGITMRLMRAVPSNPQPRTRSLMGGLCHRALTGPAARA